MGFQLPRCMAQAGEAEAPASYPPCADVCPVATQRPPNLEQPQAGPRVEVRGRTSSFTPTSGLIPQYQCCAHGGLDRGSTCCPRKSSD